MDKNDRVPRADSLGEEDERERGEVLEPIANCAGSVRISVGAKSESPSGRLNRGRSLVRSRIRRSLGCVSRVDFFAEAGRLRAGRPSCCLGLGAIRQRSWA